MQLMEDEILFIFHVCAKCCNPHKIKALLTYYLAVAPFFLNDKKVKVICVVYLYYKLLR